MKKWKKIALIILSVMFSLDLIFAISFFIYAGNYYHADDYYIDNNDIKIVEHKNYIEYNVGSPEAFIFYPGGKVEYTAYEPLMVEIAKKGVTCYLVDMPYNLAFLKVNAAKTIIKENPNIGAWYIGGHSLGGVAAASYAAKNDKIKGVVFLASYSTKKITMPSLSIVGSNDGVLNMDKCDKAKKNLASDTRYIIEGGNHGQFGNYGFQKGDKEATITKEEQWSITATYIYDFIR